MAAPIVESITPHEGSGIIQTPGAESNAREKPDPEPTTDESGAEIEDVQLVFLTGGRFWLVAASVASMSFMTNFEIPVVTTSLVAITSELHGFDRASWVVSGYLLGWVSVMILFAKLSDICGRKPVYIFSVILFAVSSAACSASQNMTELIVFRALQGVGGGGCFSLSTVIMADLVPKDRYTTFISQMSIVSSLAWLLGPIVGGAIAANTTWRWVFIVNVPIGAIAFTFAMSGIPRDFPFQGLPSRKPQSVMRLLAKSSRERMDFVGAMLLLVAVVMLTAGFEEADLQFPWRSSYVITTLVLAGVFGFCTVVWERRLTLQDGRREPVLPWTFFTNRNMAGILLVSFFLGGPLIACILLLPQRYELVHGISGLQAGVRVISFALAMPVGSGMATTILTLIKAPMIWLVLAGSCLQVAGLAILGTLPSDAVGPDNIPARMYGAQLLTGLGIGASFSLLLMVIPHIVGNRDQAVGLGATSQVRLMGSAVFVAICTAIFNSDMRNQLASGFGASDSNLALEDIGQLLLLLPPDELALVRRALVHSYNNQMLVLCASAAMQFPMALLLWRKEQLRL